MDKLKEIEDDLLRKRQYLAHAKETLAQAVRARRKAEIDYSIAQDSVRAAQKNRDLALPGGIIKTVGVNVGVERVCIVKRMPKTIVVRRIGKDEEISFRLKCGEWVEFPAMWYKRVLVFDEAAA